MTETSRQSAMEWERLAEEGCLEDAVVSYVRGYDWVTFAELQRRLKPYMNTEGNVVMDAGTPGLILWAGMSGEFAELIDGLLDSKQIYAHGADPLTYLIDGAGVALPVVKRVQAEYKSPRWLPICFRVVPPKGKPKRKRQRRREIA